MSKKTTIAAAVGSAFALSLAAAPVSADTANPFGMSDLGSGYQQIAGAHEGKCGEGKCGGKKQHEAKCGEGKCGSKKKAKKHGTEAKCGEGKCGEGKKAGSKDKEGRCGAKKNEAKCGEGKCGGKK